MFSLQIIEKRKKLEADGLVKLPLLLPWQQGHAGAWLPSATSSWGCRVQRCLCQALGGGVGWIRENIQPLQRAPALLSSAELAGHLSPEPRVGAEQTWEARTCVVLSLDSACCLFTGSR